MKNYINDGTSITVPAPRDVNSGEGVLVGAMFGFAATNAKSGEPVTIERKGLFQAAKLGAQAWADGVKVYWNNTAFQCTTVASGNTHIGYAARPAADPSDTGVVVLI